MECSRNKKRGFEQSDAAALNFTESKMPKLPTLASVVVEALKVDSLQRLCSSLEPLFRRIVSEEVERALTRLGHSQLAGRSTPPRIRATGGRNLRLEFKTRMPPHLFTGGKVEGEQGAAIHVVLIDHTTGLVVTTGPESSAKLDVVVLEGDFSEEDDDDWTKEHFENHEVKARQGKRPLLTGDLQVTLKEGIGTLGELSFTDNSSWIRSRKFRLGAKVAPGYCDEVHVREGRTEAFAVKDHRGELYKKHYPPALHDEVWRLDRIAKDGALHKKLIQADIVTVEDFLRLLVRDQQKLRNILGSAMSNRMWENTVEHAKTCVLGEKLYIYYADETHSTGVVFNHIYELRGLLGDGQFHSLESLDHTQKISVDLLVRRAYENWNRVVEYDNKVLSSLSNNKKATKSLPPIANNISDRDSYSNSMQITRSRTDESRSSFPPSMELPFSRASATVQTLNHHNHNHHPPQQLGMIPDSSGYLSVATLGGPYVSQEHHAPAQIGQGLEDFFEEEVRVRSTEMLQCDDMQKLLRSFTMGGAGGICYAEENGFSYGTPCENHQIYRTVQKEHERGSGKAVVGWLKLKAALRWGIFIRKQAAERRAQLVEL